VRPFSPSGAKPFRSNAVNLCSVSCIFLLMATFSTRPADDLIDKMAEDPEVARGLDWIQNNAAWVTAEQIHLTEIPAPEFSEKARGEYLKRLFEWNGLRVRTDALGDVIAERRGSDPSGRVILVAAHLDTVFPAGTDVRVKQEGDRLLAPGISDNGAGLAALAGLARAFSESHVQTEKMVVFAGDVGEEGEGNLRGIRALMDAYSGRVAAVIAIDGASTEHITTQGIASRRFEIAVTGPGGHSWSDFGEPNPIAAISRGVVRFSAIKIPDSPRTSFNFGIIEGGTSVNSIPTSALVKIDLRSEDESQLSRMEAALRESFQSALKDEMAAAKTADVLGITFRSLGARPAGKLPDDSPLLETLLAIDRYLGNRARLERSSTDANIPLSMGIPAVSLGGGGSGGGSHTPAEWYNPQGRTLGLKRLFLSVIALAGLSD
jgi:tripeptide aminopeptidase